MTSFCPRFLETFSSSIRNERSVPPPAAKGMYNVTGLLGNCCACAVAPSTRMNTDDRMTKSLTMIALYPMMRNDAVAERVERELRFLGVNVDDDLTDAVYRCQLTHLALHVVG